MLGHHHHHDSNDGHDHGHSHGSEALPPSDRGRRRPWLRAGLGVSIAALLVAVACLVTVPAGTALVVTRLGDPVRVLLQPGLYVRLPAPLETANLVDLRLRSTSSGFQDVGTRDGLRLLVQGFVVWQVASDPARVTTYLRSVRNDPDEAARQLRSFLASALEVSVSGFALDDLVNSDPARVRHAELSELLRRQIAERARATYGIEVLEAGLERLSLPAATLAAAVQRMQAERNVVAAQSVAEGQRQAAEIRAVADRDARVTEARSGEQAAAIEAQSQREAAAIYTEAYSTDPGLYTTLRSLDSLQTIVTPRTRLILRAEAPPFRALVEAPAASPGALPPHADAGGGTAR